MKKILIASLLSVGFAVAIRAADATGTTTNANANTFSSTYTSLSDDYVHRFGAGIILGEPTGISLKYWLTDMLAIDGAAGASYNNDHDNDADFYLHGDLLWHDFDLLKVPRGRLPVYFGVGALARFRDDEDNQVGVRIPVGLSYMFDNLPLDVFVEIGPAIDLAPDVRGEVTGGIGVRFWF